MDRDTWNRLLCKIREPHILQTWEWGTFKSAYGWIPTYHAWITNSEGNITHTYQSGAVDGEVSAVALVLQRKLPVNGVFVGTNVTYVPKGPLLQDWNDQVLRHKVITNLVDYSRAHRAIFVKIDPDVPVGMGIPGTGDEIENATGQAIMDDLRNLGWQYAQDQIQFKNTVVIKINQSDDQLLAQMKQKTRYNIRLASRRGVTVRQGTEADFQLLYRMYAETSIRDGFVIRSEDYYLQLWKMFFQSGLACPLIAEVNGEPVAGLLLFWYSNRAWYLFGMSTQAHREKMPNYLLQWEAMLLARENGCEVYDLWGAPEEFNTIDPMWNVFRFKDGLGGQVVRHIGAWDYPIHPLYYRYYTRVLPRILDWMRVRGRARTNRVVHQAI